MAVITIDLDLVERRREVNDEPRPLSELEVLTYLLRLRYVCSVVKCRVCLTRKGMHVYVYVDRYDFEKAIALRLWLGDDPIRADIDMLRWRKGFAVYVETLFNAKLSREGLSRERCVDADRFFEEVMKRL